MSLTRSEVIRIAELARLRLSGSEAEGLVEDLNEILEYVDTLSSVSLDHDEQASGTSESAPERSPGTHAPDSLAVGLDSFAPDLRDGFFTVPSPPSLGSDDGPPGSP